MNHSKNYFWVKIAEQMPMNYIKIRGNEPEKLSNKIQILLQFYLQIPFQ